jgi:enoyl-CoA hydratase/carnithine racemase
MIEEPANRIRYCGESLNIGAIVLTGSEKAFCPGGDLLEIEPTGSQDHYDFHFGTICCKSLSDERP